MVSGRYVKTFAEASHALPNGMHMNSDYPLMLPKISYITKKEVVIHDHFGKEYRALIRKHNGSEVCYISMVSSFERIFRRDKPTKYRFEPFKDTNTAPAELRADGSGGN